jgi:protein-S-isoprenylcysteine O-methyltransferase Ste14
MTDDSQPSAWRQLRAIGLLPGVGAIVVPAVLLITGDFEVGWGLPASLAWLPPLAGAVLIAAGLAVMYRTITLFATAGRGTLAPWDPTDSLVVLGPYRYVRNPMITGVLVILLGEAALFGSVALLAWFAVFFAVNAIWMPLVEEPGLERRFGADYLEYKHNVPRWLPRLRPWEPGSAR